MTYKCFEVSIENNVAHIQMSRPEKRNAMSPIFWDELPEIIRDIDTNVKARAIVISSTGPHFTAGLDISAFMQQGETGSDKTKADHGARFYEDARLMQDTFSVLENCRMPVLAAIQGGCIGGGVDLATACDMRYTTEDAFFSVHETNIAMTADVGTFPRLVNLVPEGIAREMAYTGNPLPASEALAFGLVNRVYTDQQTMLVEVMKIAHQIAQQAPIAVYGCKRMINYSRDHTTADTLDYVVTWNASMLCTDQIGEAMMAKAEKRPANFVDLPPIPTMIGR
jgi:enoyl-CoA hydratase